MTAFAVTPWGTPTNRQPGLKPRTRGPLIVGNWRMEHLPLTPLLGETRPEAGVTSSHSQSLDLNAACAKRPT